MTNLALTFRILTRTAGLIVGVALAIFAATTPAMPADGKRVALIIGNADYQGLIPLPNSLNDADDMAKKLQGLGFSKDNILLVKNASLAEMDSAIERFQAMLEPGGVSLFYYSGHGVQFQQSNYLVPIGNDISNTSDAAGRSLLIDDLISKIQTKKQKFNLIFLDACNETGLEDTGLARMSSPLGTYISYAAQPGNLASAGYDRNSVFTQELLKSIDNKGLTLSEIFQRTRTGVAHISRESQIPSSFDQLTEPFYFLHPSSAPTGRTIVANAEDPRQFEEWNEFEAFSDCDFCPEMIALPAGRFRMGSDDDRRSSPVREVEIKNPFAIGKYEVTMAEWRVCVDDGGCTNNPVSLEGNMPVTGLSYDQIKAYTRWLSRKANKIYRLPTEAEWEYAARAGSSSRYWWGNDADGGRGNFGSRGPVAVDAFASNDFGLFNVLGNVWEWVEDCFEEGYEDAPLDGTAHNVARCNEAPVRGGGWTRGIKNATTSKRGYSPVHAAYEDFGFRVARVIIKE